MNFTEADWVEIEDACRARAAQYAELAKKTDRPIPRNQREDMAKNFLRIAEVIMEDRRKRAGVETVPGGPSNKSAK